MWPGIVALPMSASCRRIPRLRSYPLAIPTNQASCEGWRSAVGEPWRSSNPVRWWESIQHSCRCRRSSRRSKNMGVYLKLMGFKRCKGGRPSGIRHWTLSTYMPPGRSPMRQDTTSALSGLASFAKLQDLLAARSNESCAEGKMTFEAFEVALGHAVRGLENELKAADLARYDVDANAVMVNGQAWRKCLEQQPKTYLSASGPITVARNLYRPVEGGKSLCPLELRAGIIGGLYTPVLARQVTYLMGHMTSDETSKVFTELGI